MNIRAKFEVKEITDRGYGDIVEAFAVYGGEKNSEDNTYSKATPWGQLSIQIDNPNARGQFKVGQKFYMDFSNAE